MNIGIVTGKFLKYY